MTSAIVTKVTPAKVHKSPASSYSKDWQKTTPGCSANKSGYSSRYHYTSCKHEAEVVFTIRGCRFFGATKAKLNIAGIRNVGKALVVNATTGKFGPAESGIRSGPAWLDKTQFVVDFDEIHMRWPDFSTPEVPPTFWSYLLKQVGEQGYKTVVFTCDGGHGRTGTALACILVAQGWPAAEAMDFIREGYCKEAIETESQEDYIYTVDEALNVEVPDSHDHN